MSRREIITLQCGHYANFVGTHWWNIQESGFEYSSGTPAELQHDVLFREGETRQGQVTFLPRLIAIDAKGAQGLMPSQSLYATTNSRSLSTWAADRTEVITSEQLSQSEGDSEMRPQNDFLRDLGTDPALASVNSSTTATYQLEDVVEIWSDMSRLHLHPRSLHLVKDLTVAELPDFVAWERGVAAGESCFDSVEDSIRYFAEGCDLMQGFNMLYDSHNAFSCVASGVLTYLAEEFPSKTRMTMSLLPHGGHQHQKVTNRALSLISRVNDLSTCLPASSVFLPLSAQLSPALPRSWPHLQYRADLQYHSSAIIAAAVDTLTLPWRQRETPAHMSDMAALGEQSQGLLATSLALPLLWQGNDVGLHEQLTTVDMSLTPLVPGMTVERWSPLCGHALSIRGTPQSRSRPLTEYQQRKLFSQFADEVLGISYAMVNLSDTPLRTFAPFPQLFDEEVSTRGTTGGRTAQDPVSAVSCATLLGAHPASAVYLEETLTAARLLRPQRLVSSRDEWLESVDQLASVLDKLKEVF